MKDKCLTKKILPKVFVSGAYFLFSHIMGRLGIRCLFKHFFHIPCPGCGITRALEELIKGNLKEAALYNPMVFSLPLLFLYFIFDGKIFGGKADSVILLSILFGFLLNWAVTLFLT